MREYRILHLEDSHSDADVIKRVLVKANLNFQYFFADDKESFIHGLTDFKPDVILCDHALPQFDSVMAFDIYKEMMFEIPFILVTGSVSEEYAVEMIKKGIDDYLLKTNLQRLPQAIKSAFDKRENEKKIRQVEQDLKQSETNLRTIFENTSSGFLLLDRNLNVISFNNQMNYFTKKSFGFDLQENVNLIAMFMVERQQEFKNLFSMILKGETISNETSYPQTDGKLIWYSIKGNPVLDQERNIAGVCLTIDNITERKNAEEKLWESEAHLTEAQRLAKMGSWNFNLKADQLTWSEELYNVFGTDKQTFRETHGSFIDLIDAEDREFALQISSHTQQTGEPFTIEYHITTPKGENRIIQEYGYGVKDENGIVTRLFGTAQDITERKNAEVQIKKQKEQYDELVKNIPVGIFKFRMKTDGKMTFDYVSPRVCKMIGIKEEDAYRDIMSAFKVVDTDDFGRLMKLIEESFFTKQNFLWEGSAIINDQLKWMKIESSPKVIEDGDILWDGVIIDLTERKKAEEKIKKYAEELESSNTELEQFAYIASHDLQEPLRMVSSFLQLLVKKYKGQLDDTAEGYINFAVDGAGRMKILIQALLMYSRVGNNKEAFTTVDLNEVALYATKVIEEDIKKNQAVITVSPLPVITANNSLISQLFINLITNAIKYCSDTKPEIEVGYSEDKRNYTIFVKDNGIGIDPKFFDKIFVIFQRLHNKDEYSGTGIGLAICKKIAEIHKGKLWVESEVGKGSTFYFSIPKTKQSA